MLLKFVDSHNKQILFIVLNITNIKVVTYLKFIYFIHNLKTNFDKILNIIYSFFQDSLNNDGNYYFYPSNPRMSDSKGISQSILCNTFGIDSANYIFKKLKTDYSTDLPDLIPINQFNRRRKRLGDLIARLNYNISSFLKEGESFHLVNSIPIPIICQITRERFCKICKENFEMAPDIGYSVVSQSWHFGYKLYLATSIRGVFSSIELSMACVILGIHYFIEVKSSGIANCTLIKDKTYISELIQTYLINTRKIRLEIPCRSNKYDKEPFPFILTKSRKRIETLFSQFLRSVHAEKKLRQYKNKTFTDEYYAKLQQQRCYNISIS